MEKREEMERMREHIYNTQDTNRGTISCISPFRFPGDEFNLEFFIDFNFLLSIFVFYCVLTDIKENLIFLIYKEIQSGAVSKSYMRKGFLIYEEMRKYFPIYEEVVSAC